MVLPIVASPGQQGVLGGQGLHAEALTGQGPMPGDLCDLHPDQVPVWHLPQVQRDGICAAGHVVPAPNCVPDIVQHCSRMPCVPRNTGLLPCSKSLGFCKAQKAWTPQAKPAQGACAISIGEEPPSDELLMPVFR